jgi:hypothetical protein
VEDISSPKDPEYPKCEDETESAKNWIKLEEGL